MKIRVAGNIAKTSSFQGMDFQSHDSQALIAWRSGQCHTLRYRNLTPVDKTFPACKVGLSQFVGTQFFAEIHVYRGIEDPFEAMQVIGDGGQDIIGRIEDVTPVIPVKTDGVLLKAGRDELGLTEGAGIGTLDGERVNLVLPAEQ